MDVEMTDRAEPAGAAQEDMEALVARAAAANAALLRGDMPAYAALVRHTDDFTLMSPFGGPPTHGFDRSSERLALGRFSRNGVTGQEVVQAPMVAATSPSWCRSSGSGSRWAACRHRTGRCA